MSPKSTVDDGVEKADEETFRRGKCSTNYSPLELTAHGTSPAADQWIGGPQNPTQPGIWSEETRIGSPCSDSAGQHFLPRRWGGRLTSTALTMICHIHKCWTLVHSILQLPAQPQPAVTGVCESDALSAKSRPSMLLLPRLLLLLLPPETRARAGWSTAR